VGFREVPSRTGLSGAELAYLYQVPRQTIHYWLHRGSPWPGSHAARAAENVTRILLNAVDTGILPMAQVSKTVRRERIKKMGVILHSIKPTPVKLD